MGKQVDLLNEPILPALARLAVPIMATYLVQMAYNLTDMAWIGRLGSGAVTAVGTAGMYSWLSQGIAILAKTGGQVKVAHALGAGDEEAAARYARGAIQMGVVFALAFGAVCLVLAGPLIGFFGLASREIVESAMIYLRIACGCILFSYINMILTGLLTATGDSRTPFKVNVAGLVLNVILDPLLIFGAGPVPAMGTVGAAVATVAAQAAVTVLFILAIRRESRLFKGFSLFTPVPPYCRQEMVRIGMPAAVQNLIYAGISMILTRLVAGYGDKAVAVQRVGSQIESVSWMVGDGFAAAINSFIGQNFGAKQMDRVKRGFSTAIAMTALWGLCTTSLLIFMAGPLFSVFITEPAVLAGGVDYLRILGFSQLFMLVEQTSVGAFAGLGRTGFPSAVSVTLTSARIPMAVLFSATALGLNGIWWALTVSSILKGCVLYAGFLFVLKRMARGGEK